MNKELEAVFSKRIRPGTRFILVRLFTFILISNVLSLLPFIFTPFSHISLTIALALPLWAGHFIFRALKNPKKALAHLLPLGTPVFLIVFIVIIELVRSIIRPLTLSVRLAANIIAGHLLISLLGSSMIPTIGISPIFLVFLSIFSCLIFLEIAVSVIQAYVFILLSTLYINEVDPNNLS